MIPQRTLGATGLRVSALGFGGAPIGISEDARAETVVPLLRRAVDLGITFFDTAPDYRRSEELIGLALGGRRSDVVLATKCGRLQSWNGTEWEVREDWTEDGVYRSIEASLGRLGTGYLDLVQLHSPPMWVLDEGAALRGLRRAQAAGRVRHIGVSADGDEARRALELDEFATLQVSYSVLQQEAGADLLPLAAAKGVGVIVKQPLANGIPGIRERPGHPDWILKWEFAQRIAWPAPDSPRRRLELTLRWLLADPLIGTAIVGTTRRDHLEANVAAASAPPLDPGVRRRLQEAYRAARTDHPLSRS